MNSKELIEECIKEQYKETISTIFKNKNKQKLSEEDLIKEFENLWVSESSGSEKATKVKKVSKRKDVLPEEQCHALKKDTQRCKGRKHKDGENPLLCSLHNTKGPTYGMISETPISDTEINIEDEEIDDEEFN